MFVAFRLELARNASVVGALIKQKQNESLSAVPSQNFCYWYLLQRGEQENGVPFSKPFNSVPELLAGGTKASSVVKVAACWRRGHAF